MGNGGPPFFYRGGGVVSPFALQSAFYRIIQNAAAHYEIDYVFIDVGPNFGAINRGLSYFLRLPYRT